MPSLTLAEAEERASLLEVDHYAVALDLTRDDGTFDSVTRIRFACARPGSQTFLDVQPRALRSATLNGEPVDAAELADGRLPLRGLAGTNTLVIEADMAFSHDGEGLHRAVDPADGRVYLYAMSFLDAAPRIFACFDQPDLKARFDVTVTAPEGWSVTGNGRATQEQPGRWRLATTRPLSTYFVTLVAGPYHSVLSEHDGIRLGLHVKQSLAEHLDDQAAEILTVTRACFDEFHRLFGIRYPFGDYHQAFVPEFNAGAMENPGCVTLRDSLIFRSRPTHTERSTRANTIAHEMAHQWFGNLVTMRWWDDLWLNESFAEYMGYRVCDAVTDFRDGWVDAALVRNRWGMVCDGRASTHPVAGRDAVDAATALNNFDGISYAKGASVLKQLVVHIGDEVFVDGVVRHLRDHSFGNASFADLVGAWTAAGAVGLQSWTEQWLRTCGADVIEPETADRPDGEVSVRLTRSAPAGHPAERPHTFWVGAFGERGAGPEILVSLTGGKVEVPLAIEGFPVVVADVYDDTWAKVRIDGASLRGLRQVLPAIQAPITRAVVWNAQRFAVDDGVLDPFEVLELLEAALPRETHEVALGSMLGWARNYLAARYIRERVGGRRVASLAAACLRHAEPASSRQLVAARAVVASSYDTELLRGWLAGDDVPDGLTVDAELRWSLLRRLATLGSLDRSEIEAEADRDRSAQGLVHAASCRAALPDPDAKAQAWDLLTSDRQVGNYVLYATAGGFWQPSQLTLTDGYVERYFTEMPRTSEFRQGWVVSHSLALAFPHPVVEARILELADHALATDLESGVRRSIADGADDLRRALSIRNRWGG
jgi:aminopeptidase N